MAYSYVRYTGDGSQTNFTFSIPYIAPEHIKVRVNDVLTSYTFLSASIVQVTPAPANGAIVEIRRQTPRDTVMVDYTDGSIFGEADLDLSERLGLYYAQETQDDVEDCVRLDYQGNLNAQGNRVVNATDGVVDTDLTTLGQVRDEIEAAIAVSPQIVSYNSQTFNASEGQAVFTLDNVYSPGNSSLAVYLNGSKLVVGQDYTETSVTSFTLLIPASSGDVVVATTAQFVNPAMESSNSVEFVQSGAGAVARSAQDKLRESVSVLDFGAVGDGVTDDTAAIQAAIDTGKPVEFLDGSYACGLLTQSTNFQRFYARGHVNLIKNTNGVLFSSSGNYVELDGLQFIGTGFTGDNINMTGNHPRLVNCSSYGTPGRALKATGAHVEIIGTCGIYATTDATASGYDIEIGQSGTATLYHQLMGVYTSQPTGGILLIDTGSHVISGGQFGKLTIQAGTSPAGSNGGITANARILGDVTVGLSNSVFSGNQFSTQTITFNAGTSGHSLDHTNILESVTIVNSGSSDAAIIKSIGTGSPAGIVLQYGSDAFNSTIRYSNDEIYLEDANLFLANAKSIRFADSGGTTYSAVNLNANDDWTFGANNGANFTALASGSVGVFQSVSATSITQCTSSAFRPVPNGTIDLGGSSNRWGTVYAATGTINTSDARAKQDIEPLCDAEQRVAKRLKGLVRRFRMTDAVAKKGDDARIHIGVIAQEVAAAFDAEGLDAHRYAILCHDTWEAEDAVVDESGNVIIPAKPAGDQYGIRYDQLLAFVVSAL